MLTLFYEEYSPVLIMIILAVVLSLIILGASFFLSVQKPDTEKLSAYECGFDPYEDARNAFDVRFYIVAMLFIIFDLEAMFLFPWVVSITHTGSLGFWVMIDFLVELTVGFIYAWKVGALEWE
jgi:NADH-quinone oxidoreductase subunit A